MIQAVLGAMSLVGKLGDKMIEDKDARLAFVQQQAQNAHELMMAVLKMPTYPVIDALVKLAYASEAIIKGLFRPVFSCGLFIWGMVNPESVAEIYNQLKDFGYAGEIAVTTIFGAAPAWGVDRAVDKRRKAKKQAAFEEEEF